MPRDKRKTAARTLAAESGLPYTAARRAAIQAHRQEHTAPGLPDTLLSVEDVAEHVATGGRVDRLLLGLTWEEAPLWANLPAKGHVGVFENGFAGSRALCRHLALQARTHGADVHVLAPAGAPAYPGLAPVVDPAQGRRLLVGLERTTPTEQRPVYVVLDDPRALTEDIPSRSEAFAALARLLTRGPEHLHVVLRCEAPGRLWPLSAFAAVAVTGVSGPTWREVTGETISEAATSGPDLWTFLPGPDHHGQGVLHSDLNPHLEKTVVAFVPGAPDAPTPSASRNPHHGQTADQDWARYARARIRAGVDRYAPGAAGARFEAGEVLRMHQGGRGGRSIDSSWWTSHDTDGAYLFTPQEVSVVEELPAESTPPTNQE